MLVEADPPPQSPLRAVTDAVAADPGADHSVKTLAARASLSTRQLTRLFQSELGMTPARYVEWCESISPVAHSTPAGPSPRPRGMAGFGSTETLRRVFVNHLGVISPKAYRDRVPQRACAAESYLVLLYLVIASSSRCSAAP